MKIKIMEPYEVELTGHNFEDAMRFCHAHFKDWSVAYQWIGRSYEGRFKFRDAKDAIYFKLRWCG